MLDREDLKKQGQQLEKEMRPLATRGNVATKETNGYNSTSTWDASKSPSPMADIYEDENYRDYMAVSAMPGMRDDPEFQKYERVSDAEKFDTKAAYINNAGNTRDWYASPGGPGGGQDIFRKYSFMAPMEVYQYNYAYDNFGREAAEEYLKSIDRDLDYRSTTDWQKQIERQSRAHPFLSSAASVAMQPIVGMAGAADIVGQNVKKAFTGEDVNYYNPIQSAAMTTQSARQGASRNIESDIGKFIYQTGMSGVDSLVASALGPYGWASLGASSGADTARELHERGASDGQALLTGVAAGIAEGLFEKLSIGQFKALKEAPAAGVKDLLMNMGKSAFVNFSEEAATEFSNIVSDFVIDQLFGGDKSQYDTAMAYYKKHGMTEEQAFEQTKKDMRTQIIKAGIGGALMGGVFGAIGSTQSYRQGVQYANALEDTSNATVQSLIDEGMKSDPKSESYKAAGRLQKKLDNGKKITKGEIGQLYRETEQEVVRETAAFHDFREAVGKTQRGEKLTDREVRALLKNRNLAAILGINTEGMTDRQKVQAVRDGLTQFTEQARDGEVAEETTAPVTVDPVGNLVGEEAEVLPQQEQMAPQVLPEATPTMGQAAPAMPTSDNPVVQAALDYYQANGKFRDKELKLIAKDPAAMRELGLEPAGDISVRKAAVRETLTDMVNPQAEEVVEGQVTPVETPRNNVTEPVETPLNNVTEENIPQVIDQAIDQNESVNESVNAPAAAAVQSIIRNGGQLTPEQTDMVLRNPATLQMLGANTEGMTQEQAGAAVNDAVRSLVDYSRNSGNRVAESAEAVAENAMPAQTRETVGTHIDDRTVEGVGKRSVKAFQFDNPAVHLYYAEAADALLGDLNGTQKGERFPVKDENGYVTGYEGVPRFATDAVETMLDDYGLTYAEAEKALNAIIHDEGQENYAAAKRVEFILDDMLENGYTDINGIEVPANQDYIRLKNAMKGESAVAETEGGADAELPQDLPQRSVPEEIVNSMSVSGPATEESTGLPEGVQPTDSVGAAPHGFDLYDDLLEKYGPVEPGMNPTNDLFNEIPRSRTGEDVTSKAGRSFMESPNTNYEMTGRIADLFLDGKLSHLPLHNSEVVQRVLKAFDAMGPNESLKRWTADVRDGKTSADITTMGVWLYDYAVMHKDYDTAMDIVAEMTQNVTDAGRAVQAFKLVKMLTPEGKLFVLQKQIDRINGTKLMERQIRKEERKNGGEAGRAATRAVVDVKNAATEELEKSFDSGAPEATVGAEKSSAEAGTSKASGEARKVADKIAERAKKKAQKKKSEEPKNWLDEIGDRMAGIISDRVTGKVKEKETSLDRVVLRDLMKFAESYLPAQVKPSGNNAYKTLSNYMQNRDEYARAWNRAAKQLREKYRDSPELLDRLDEFLGGTLDYNATGDDKVMKSAIRAAMKESGITDMDLAKNLVLGDNTTESTIGKTLSERVNADESGQSQMTGAVSRYAREALENRAGKVEDAILGDIRKTLKEMGFTFNELSRQHDYVKQEAGKYLAKTLSEKYGIPPENAGRVSANLIDRLAAAVDESAVKTLDAMAAPGRDGVLKTQAQKLDELGNMGVQRSDKYREILYRGMERAITEAALDGDTTVRDIIRNATLGDIDAVTERIYNRLSDNLLSEKFDETTLRNAVKDYVSRSIQKSRTDVDRLVLRDAAAMLKDMGYSFNSLARANDEVKREMNWKLSEALVSQYGISKAQADRVSDLLTAKIQAAVRESGAQTLEALIAEKPAGEQKSSAQKLDELGNMGALESDRYAGPVRHGMESAIAEAILQEDTTIRDLVRNAKIGDLDHIRGQVYNRLAGNLTSGKFSDTVLRNAVDDYLSRAIQKDNRDTDRMVESAIRDEVKNLGTSMAEIIRSNNKTRAALIESIRDKLITDYGISARGAEQASRQIVTVYDRMVREQSDRTLDSLFKDREKTPPKGFMKKFEELGNMGAFYSDYAEKAAERITGQPGIRIDPELAGEYLEAETEEERLKIMDQIFEKAAEGLPSTVLEKLDDIRYTSMLSAPKTHGKNILGSGGYFPVRFLRDRMAGAIESAVAHTIAPELPRTKSFKISYKMYRDGLKAYKEYRQVMESNRFDDVTNELSKRKRVWKNRVGKFLPKSKNRLFEFIRTHGIRNSVSYGNSRALEVEDDFFKKLNFADTYANFMIANGVTHEMLESGQVSEELKEQAVEYAAEQALQATFNERNAFSDRVTRITKDLGLVGEGINPFKRVPANVALTAVKTSPLGAALTAYDIYKMRRQTDSDTGQKITGAKIIEDLAANMTGTALAVFGAIMRANDLVTGGEDDDENQAKLDKLTGKQEYSMRLDDGTYYSMNWMSPQSVSFFMGVEFANALEKEGLTGDAFINALSSIGDSLLQNSFMQGINDALDSISFADSDKKAYALIASALRGYAGQFIPTLFGQFERTFEDERMTTFVEQDSAIPSDFQYALGKLSQKLPIYNLKTGEDMADYHQIPFIDAWGRRQSNGSRGMSAFENLASPGFISQENLTAVDKELYRLLGLNSEDFRGVVPQQVKQDYEISWKDNPSDTVDKKRYMTADEYVRFAEIKGKKQYELLDQIIRDPLYKRLPDSDKAKVISSVYEYAGHIASEDITKGKHDSGDTVENAKNAKADLGLPESKYLIYVEKYGSTTMNGDRVRDAHDIGVPIDTAVEVFDVKSQLKAADAPSYEQNIREMEKIMGLPNLTSEQKLELAEVADIPKGVIKLAAESDIPVETQIKAYKVTDDVVGIPSEEPKPGEDKPRSVKYSTSYRKLQELHKTDWWNNLSNDQKKALAKPLEISEKIVTSSASTVDSKLAGIQRKYPWEFLPEEDE